MNASANGLAKRSDDCAGCRHRNCELATFQPRAARHGLISYERGHRPGAPGPGMLRLRVVLGGLLAVAAGLPDGRRQLIELEGPGDVICAGESGDDGIWVEVLTSSLVCEMDFAAADLRQQNFLHALFGVTHRKLAGSAGRMVVLGRLDGAERVCGFLADMARRIGLQRQGSWYLQLPMSREDIADYLGLNAETVSRILGRIRKAGLVRFVTPTELMLPDLDALEARGAGPLRPRTSPPLVGVAP